MPPPLAAGEMGEFRADAAATEGGVEHTTAGIEGGDGVDKLRGGGGDVVDGGGGGGGGDGGGACRRDGVDVCSSFPPPSSCLGWSESPPEVLDGDGDEEEVDGTLYVTTSWNSRSTNTGVSRVR